VFYVLLLAAVETSSTREKADSAIFYLGDSTTEKIYFKGLQRLLNCTKNDINVDVIVEANNQTGLLCYPRNRKVICLSS